MISCKSDICFCQILIWAKAHVMFSLNYLKTPVNIPTCSCEVSYKMDIFGPNTLFQSDTVTSILTIFSDFQALADELCHRLRSASWVSGPGGQQRFLLKLSYV